MHTFAAMAKVPTFSLLIIIILLSLLAISLPTSSQGFSTKLSKREMGRPEQLTHLHFYLHNLLRGEAATNVVVAQAATTNTYKYRLGEVAVFDDRLTEGPDLRSRAVGRAQGMYAYADVNEVGFLMVYNFFFTEEGFNGSTLSVVGRNAVDNAEREMPILGGSGVFRFARGYARIKTYFVDGFKGIAVEEYNVYVFHY